MSELPTHPESLEGVITRLQEENAILRAENADLRNQIATTRLEQRTQQIREEWRRGLQGGLSEFGVSHDLFERGYTYDD